MRGTGWPLVIIERAKSEKPLTPVLCEVWGLEHESGSVYLKDIYLVSSVENWREIRAAEGHTSMYFKGQLTAEDMPPKAEKKAEMSEAGRAILRRYGPPPAE